MQCYSNCADVYKCQTKVTHTVATEGKQNTNPTAKAMFGAAVGVAM